MRILIAKNAHTKTLKEKIIWAAPAESGALLNIELAGTTFPDAEYRIARGGTSFFVIEAVLSGKGFIESEDTRLCVQAGDCYFLNRDMPVTYYADRKDPYQKIWVNLSGRLVDGLVLSYGIHEAVLVSHAPLSPLLSTLHSLLKKEDCEERKALLIHRMIRMFADENFLKSTAIRRMHIQYGIGVTVIFQARPHFPMQHRHFFCHVRKSSASSDRRTAKRHTLTCFAAGLKRQSSFCGTHLCPFPKLQNDLLFLICIIFRIPFGSKRGSPPEFIEKATIYQIKMRIPVLKIEFL